MTTKTEKMHKEHKLITYKNRDGSYTTYVFLKGSVKSIAKYTQALKKHSIGMAECAIDNNDMGGCDHG
jgi:hypothetical protein